MSRIFNAICVVVIFICSTSCTPQVETSTAGWEQLPRILREIRAPEFPDRVFDITRFGAKSGGKKDCTKAFRAVIEACNKAGGGRVVVPAGTYLTGPIHLKSNVCLEINKAATVHFSDIFEDYLPPVLIRWEGKECYNLSPLIYANGCTNIAVVGGGTLVGHRGAVAGRQCGDASSPMTDASSPLAAGKDHDDVGPQRLNLPLLHLYIRPIPACKANDTVPLRSAQPIA